MENMQKAIHDGYRVTISRPFRSYQKDHPQYQREPILCVGLRKDDVFSEDIFPDTGDTSILIDQSIGRLLESFHLQVGRAKLWAASYTASVTVLAEFLFELKSKQQWVSRVPDILPARTRAGEQLIWVDKNGCVFEIGSDFDAAEILNTFPCRVYRPVNVGSQLKEVSNG